MAQGESTEETPNDSRELDMVAVFRSDNFDAEMEAMAVHTVLEANGIQSVVVGPSVLPNLEFQVQVTKLDFAAAEKALADAEAAGPVAAAEAEAEGEQGS